MHLSPGKRLHRYVQVVGAGTGHFQHGSGREAGAGMAVVLHLDMGIFLFDIPNQFTQEGWTADAGHVFEADLVGAVFHHFVHDAHVVFHRVDGGVGDGQGYLGNHAAFLGPFHRAAEVARIVEAAEGTGDIGSLFFLDHEHQVAHVLRNGIHAQGVQTAFQHVGLDAGFVEGGRPAAYRHVRILAEEEVNLLESAAVGLDAVETAHVDDGRSHFYQLIHAGNVFSRTLPHVPVNQGELDFFCHI